MKNIDTKQTPKQEAKQVRLAVLEGYKDAIEGRVVEFKGDLKNLVQQAGTKVVSCRLSAPADCRE